MRKTFVWMLMALVIGLFYGCTPKATPTADTTADAEVNVAVDADVDQVDEEEMNGQEEVGNDVEGEENDEEQEDVEIEVRDGEYTFDVGETDLTWKAEKIVGGHDGVVAVKEGTAIYAAGKLIGGSAVIDMTTIKSTDNGGNESLDGHLRSEDFFDVENYEEATIDVTEVVDNGDGTYNVKADLTIKGITNPQEFVAVETENGFTAEIVIDRLAYDIIYNSGNFFEDLGDKAIKDEFTMNLDAVLQ